MTKRGDLYEARLSDGSTLRVRDGRRRVRRGHATPHAPARSPRLQPEPVEGASGSLVVRADAEGIAREIIKPRSHRSSACRTAVESGLLEARSTSCAARSTTSTDGMKGKISLTLD